MKKLLLLGGSKFILPVIKKAHELDLQVVTCDFLPNNYAHKYADNYINVSIIDKDAVLTVAEKEKIDGIMSFACDPGVTTAAYVAEKLGLPSCGPYESVKILQNKGSFREFLTNHNFNVPVSKSYKNKNDAIKNLDMFNWPIIVKPTDCAGSKGVVKVNNKNDVSKAIDIAINYSLNNEFIIEDYLQQVGYSSDTDSFSVDGKLKFVSFNCQKFDKNAKNPYTPAAYRWPSSMMNKSQQILTKEIQRLISLLKLKTSLYNIETRECINGKPYIMEMAPRAGGNRLAECLEFATGVNLIENSIRAAVGLSTIPISQNDYKGFWAEIILHSTKNGQYDNLWISDEIKNNVYEKDVWVKKGDAVKSFNSANEAIGTLVLKFNSEVDMNKVFEHQNKYIKVETF